MHLAKSVLKILWPVFFNIYLLLSHQQERVDKRNQINKLNFVYKISVFMYTIEILRNHIIKL